MQWHEKLQDYNFKILHILGKNNTLANALSHPEDNEQEVGERQLLLLPQEAFLNLTEAGLPDSLETLICNTQCQYKPKLKAKWERSNLEEDQGLWMDKDGKIVIPPD